LIGDVTRTTYGGCDSGSSRRRRKQGPGVVPFWCEMPVWDDLCEYEVMRERGVSACRRDEGARLR
jgi:hypothetical protein